MATSKRYAEVAELKSAAGIPDTTDDRRIGAVLDAISRALDDYCGWRFYTTADDETRYYPGSEWGDTWFCPDPIISLTTFSTDADGDRTYEDDWETTDYDLLPYNAALDKKPYTHLETTQNGDYSFPSGNKSIKAVGKFGWPEVPDQIREATILCGEKLFKRKDAVFGVMGVTELGIVQQIIKEDPELNMLLNSGGVRRVV